MKFRTILLFVTIAFSQILHATNQSKFRIIYNSNQINNRIGDTLQIKDINVGLFSNVLVVKLENDKKIFYKPQSIWGYEDEKGTYYRYFKNEFYRIEQIDTIMIYSYQNEPSALDRDYYFSKTKNSMIFNLSRKKVRRAFCGNPCFLEKLEKYFKLENRYLSIDTMEAGSIIVDLYKQCKHIKNF